MPMASPERSFGCCRARPLRRHRSRGAGWHWCGPEDTTSRVGRLQPGTRYSFGLFAAYRGGGYAAVTRTRATTGPDPVGHLRAFLDGSSVELRWTAPTTPSIASVLVRIAVGATPPSTPSSGTLVAQRGPGTTSVRLPGLRKGTRYSVSVWTRDAAGRWSTPAHTGFTTLSGTRRDASVAGVVTDTAGHPLSGVVVFAISYDTFTAYMRDRTDADGRYHFAAPAGRYLLALDAASAQGGIADSFGYVGSAHIVRLESGRTHRQDFALRAGGIVQGVVRDSDGNALAGVTPILQGVTPYVDVDDSSLIVFSEELGIDGRTGPTGRFVLRGVPPGGYLTCYDTSSGRVSGGGSDATGYVAQCGQATIVARARSGHGARSGRTSCSVPVGHRRPGRRALPVAVRRHRG